MEQLSAPSGKEWLEWLMQFSIPAFILVGIILFLVGARSGRYNLKCILSPAICLSGFLVVWMAFQLEERNAKATRLLNAFGGGFILILVAALICSILGLIEYSKQPRYSHKRRGARYAVITGLFCFLGLVFFALSLYSKKVYGTRNPIKGLVQERRIRIIDLGFQIYLPREWVQIDGSQLKPTPCLTFTRTNPSLSFALVVQKPGPSTPTRIEDLIKLAQSQVLQVNSTANFSDPTIQDQSSASSAATANFESLVTRGAFTYFYVHRVILYRGLTFQLITWGPSNDPNSVRDAAELMNSKFSVLSF